MDKAHNHEISRHRLVLVCPDGIGPATPYRPGYAGRDHPGPARPDRRRRRYRLGIQAIVALLQGASLAYVLDVDATAVATAIANAARNGVAEGIAPLVAGRPMLPLPPGGPGRHDHLQPGAIAHALVGPRRQRVFYAGRDGRRMIDALIRRPERLAPGGRLLMTHGSMADLPAASLSALARARAAYRGAEVARVPPVHRSGPPGRARRHGPRSLRATDGRPFETVRVVEATRR